MKNRILLSGAGCMALAGALAATPAYASNEEADSTDTAEEQDEQLYRLPPAASPRIIQRTAGTQTVADGTSFAGFDIERYLAPQIGTVDLSSSIFNGGDSSGPVIDPRIIVRDDVGLDASFDADDTQPSVVQLFVLNNVAGGLFLNCTGTLINPRTVLSAAHCFNENGTRSAETYGLPGSGAELTSVIGFGPDTNVSLGTGNFALSTDVVVHATSEANNGAQPFPFADIALVALDRPITDVPSAPILLSPLTELTHVIQVGYGTFGTAFDGTPDDATQADSLLRRVGENVLGLVGSFADFTDVLAEGFAPTANLGVDSQTFYWTDFDWPDRDAAGFDGCTPNGTGGINCEFVGDILATDFFDGDALPREVGTAPGDSGSPLIVDELYEFPVVTAVLSGGVSFFDTTEFGLPAQTFGDISFYQPLYPFFEFISENTAYKYVSALAGDGLWSDASRWTQDLDPGFFIDDGTGTLVNGLPGGSEPGIFETGPNVGTVFGVDTADFPEIVSTDFPEEGTPNFGANTPNSSALLGPGSTGFVPQNTDGTIGTTFANPAQYFEVHLANAGRTTVDIDVEIDKLVVNNFEAALFLPEAQSFTVLQDVEQFDGTVEVDGTFNTPFYFLVSGEVAGDGGTINTNVLLNANGLLNAGGFGSFGELTINGDYLQTSGGGLLTEFSRGRRRTINSDTYNVTGTALLGGTLLVGTQDRRPRFGTEFTALTAGAIDGTFDETVLLSNSATLQAESRVEGNEVIVEITARSLRSLFSRGGSRERSSRSRGGIVQLAGVVDSLRETRFDQFVGLFDVIDSASLQTLGATLNSISPVNAFSQTFTANSFSQRFTGQIAQRTLTLRDGSRAAGGFTAAGNVSYAIAGQTPTDIGKVAMFGTASGIYLNGGQQQQGILGNGTTDSGSTQVGANAFEQLSLSEAGEITVGADVRVTDGFSFGVAVSNIRNSQLSLAGDQPQEDNSRSVAIYATYADNGFFADGYAGTADQRLGATRQSAGEFSAFYDNAIGQSDGDQVFGGVRLGYAFDLGKGMEVGPVASMDYLSSDIGGFDETGAGAFGLSVDDRNFTSVGAKIGAMASFDIKTTEKTALKAFGSVAYARELGDTEDVITAHFFGAEDAAFSFSNSLDPEWVSVNAGAEMLLGNNFSASVSVTSDMGRGVLSNDQAQASLSWRF